MKLTSVSITIGATISTLNTILASEDTLIRVKRQSDQPKPIFECTFKDEYGFEEIWDQYENDEEGCLAEKNMIFELECEEDCEESTWGCSSEGIASCVKAQTMVFGRSGKGGPGRKLGMKYYRWKAVARMIGHIVAKPTLSKKQVIKKMINYGCHCFPGGKKTRTVGGKGPAMDEIDGVCRTQFQCHKCVEMDTGCNPDETPYKAQFKGKKNQLVKDVICRDAEDSCGRAMCECDKRMAENLEKIWFVEGQHNGYYWKDRRNARKNPTFDYEGTCLVPGSSPQPDTCCGEFPNVVPYNAASKDCCVQSGGPRLFDPMTHTCCAGGLVATAGSC